MLLDDNDVLLILFMVVLILLVIYLIGFINRSTTYDYPYKCNYAEINEMKTGDLVCAAYYNIAGAIVTSFSQSIWSHTGTIWIDPITSIKYVLEGAIYRHKKYNHFFKIPIETWLYFNRKSLLGYKKYHGPQIDSNYLWQKFEWMVNNCKLEGFNIFWARFLLDKEYYEYTRKDKYTCLEATIILGQEAGIYKKNKIYCSYFPDHVVNNKISLCKNIFYDLPIQISLNPTDLMLIKEDIMINSKFWKK